jgi:tRNA G10  N-methylase Trm11
MSTYLAFLGHQPHISIAELAALLPDIRFTRRDKTLAIFETNEELDQAFLNLLGGTFVLAKQITSDDVSLSDIPALLANEVQGGKRSKVTFSLRTMGLSSRVLKDLYRNCKGFLKKKEQPSRYVGNEHKAAMPIVLHENDMIEGKRGVELVIISDNETGDLPDRQAGLWVGRTVGAQDIEAYAKRDVHKPVRDTTVGLLPPKLAQILINLGAWAALQSGTTKAKTGKKFTLPEMTVWDPFCGTGVIPMECLLRRWTVLASDISIKGVNGCTKNLEWLRKEEKITKKDVESTVIKHDAQKPFPFKDKPAVIVTETSLGPSLTKRPTLKEMATMRSQNEKLQEGFLRNVKATLPGVPVVCTFPVWYPTKGPEGLQRIWKAAAEMGYKVVLPVEASKEMDHASLLYRRPDQMVGREIAVFIPA